VKLLRGAWNEAFLAEAEAFGAVGVGGGVHDEQIDSAVASFSQLCKKPGPTGLPGFY
jgi:hypothetical protein